MREIPKGIENVLSEDNFEIPEFKPHPLVFFCSRKDKPFFDKFFNNNEGRGQEKEINHFLNTDINLDENIYFNQKETVEKIKEYFDGNFEPDNKSIKSVLLNIKKSIIFKIYRWHLKRQIRKAEIIFSMFGNVVYKMINRKKYNPVRLFLGNEKLIVVPPKMFFNGTE